jgi:hypothetical protein
MGTALGAGRSLAHIYQSLSHRAGKHARTLVVRRGEQHRAITPTASFTAQLRTSVTCFVVCSTGLLLSHHGGWSFLRTAERDYWCPSSTKSSNVIVERRPEPFKTTSRSSARRFERRCKRHRIEWFARTRLFESLRKIGASTDTRSLSSAYIQKT